MDTNNENQGQTPDVPPVSTEQHTGTSEPRKYTEMAIIAYVLFFVPLLTDAKDDPFVKYHVKQGLTLFIVWLALSIVSWVPPIMFLAPLLHVGLLVLMVIGMVRASQRKEEPLPLIGQFASHFHF